MNLYCDGGMRLVTLRLIGACVVCVQVQEAGGGDAESLQQNHHQAAEHLQNGRGAGQRRAPDQI